MTERTTRNERTLVGARITIYRRGKRQIYYADFHRGGQHCRRSLRTTIKRIALQRAMKLEQSLEDGTYLLKEVKMQKPTKTMTIAEAAKAFVAYNETEGKRRKTVVKQRGILNRFVDFASRQDVRELTDVNLILIDEYRAMRKETLSAKSMVNEGQCLRQFLTWCVERQLMGQNPLAGRKFRPPKYEPRKGPSLEQINAILKIASPTRFPVLATLAFTGVRSGEVAHLLVEDVDLEANWLHFVSRPGYETKSGNSWKVPIHARLRPILEKQLQQNRSGWLFTALPSRKYPKGDHQISTKHLNEGFLQVLNKLELPAGRDGGFTVHSLRRSFKTICVNAGIPREAVDVWQDHAHIRTPGDLYYSLPDEESQQFMKIVPFGTAE